MEGISLIKDDESFCIIVIDKKMYFHFMVFTGPVI